MAALASKLGKLRFAEQRERETVRERPAIAAKDRQAAACICALSELGCGNCRTDRRTHYWRTRDRHAEEVGCCRHPYRDRYHDDPEATQHRPTHGPSSLFPAAETNAV